MWTAWHLTELAPGIRIRILEQDICGGGPSGRNGGFVTGAWDELGTLVERHGDAEGLRIARQIQGAVDEIGAWCQANGVDAWFRKDGYLQVSAAPAQDGAWDDVVALAERLGVGEAYRPLSPDDVALRVRSPVFRAGVFMADAATVQPAFLARGLRRVLMERGVVIHEGTTAGPVPADRRRGGLSIRTRSSRGDGAVDADQVVVALNAWAGARRPFGGRLVSWSSYIVLTEPLGDRLAELGWTGGEGLTDARFTLHYARTTNDGRIALGGGGGRPASGRGSGGRTPMTPIRRAGPLPACGAGSPRWRTSGSTTPGVARSTSRPTTCRSSGRSAAGRSISVTATRAMASRRRGWAAGSWPGSCWGGRTSSPRWGWLVHALGRSPRSRFGAWGRGWCGKPSSAGSWPRSAAGQRAGSSANSAGCHGGWAITSARRTERW